MRRKDREVTEEAKIYEIMEACDCCRLGFCDDKEAYILPLNFGYVKENGRLVLYFHGAAEGRKIDLIKKSSGVSFEMDTRHQLTEGEKACEYSFLYQSIMGKGDVFLVQEKKEKLDGLKTIMEHCRKGREWEFSEKAVEKTAVIRLEVNSISCKEHRE